MRAKLMFGLAFFAAACSSPAEKGGDKPVVIIANNGTTGTNNGVVTECGPGRVLCSGACVDGQFDSTNCGTCGNNCSEGTVCSAGQCAPVPADCRTEGECPSRYFCDEATGFCEPGCSSNADCPSGSYCELESHACLCAEEGNVVCGTECVAESPSSCGTTCETCPGLAGGSATCEEGVCGQECNEGSMMCDGACAVCPSGAGIVSVGCLGAECVATECESGHEICDGVCAACPATTGSESLGCDGQECIITDCPAGTKLCGGECADCPDDPSGTTACQGNQCILVCSGGLHSCGDYCADDEDPFNCGANCQSCPGDSNGEAVCNAGSCGLTCDADYRACQGACAACPTTAGVTGTTCAGGSCVASSCSAGYQACSTGCCRPAPDGVAFDYTESISSVSLELDSRGYPHMAMGSASGNSVYYVYWDGSAWQNEYVTSGWAGSIGLDLAEKPHIAIWKRNPDGLWLAVRDPNNGWQLEEVDNTFNDVGMTPDLEMVGNTPHIAYFDLEQDNLRYAVKNGNSWSDQVVASTGEIGFSPDLEIDGGDVHILCRDETNDSARHVYNTSGSFVPGTLDDTRDSGNYSSLAISSNGNLHAAYVEEGGLSNDTILWNEYENGAWGLEEFVANGDFPSIVVNSINQWIIVYQNTSGELAYKKFPQRNEVVLDDTGFVGDSNEAELDGATGRVHVVYNGLNRDLNYVSFAP